VENMKQNAASGVINDVMRTRMNTPWPVLNPVHKEFQRLPEVALVKLFEESTLRARSAPALANLADLSKLGQCSNQSRRIFASSA